MTKFKYIFTFQVEFDEDGCYDKNDYFSEGDKYQQYMQVNMYFGSNKSF